MVVFPKLVIVSHKNQQPRWLNPSNQLFTLLIRHSHSQSNLDRFRFDSPGKPPSSKPHIQQKKVAIFWDLDNKPPNPIPPHEAALKLKKTASAFGLVRHMVAYANRHSFCQVPRGIREQRNERRALNQLENKGLFKPADPYHCGVCGRNFYNYEKFVNHFKNIHERENTKRLNQIESARGSRRVKLVAKYSMKLEKYKRASRDVLTPKVGYGLGEELERAGFWVREVCNKPQSADMAMRSHIVDLMDKRRVECLVIVSDDSGFVSVLQEAKMRCVKTVVVGNASDGALKRAADSGFLWREVMMGKAKKEAVSVLGKWKDRDVLRRLEWTYDPEVEKSLCGGDDADHESVESCVEGVGDCVLMEDDESRSWWEIDSGSDSDAISSQ